MYMALGNQIMKFRKINILIFIFACMSLRVAESNGDLTVSGATLTNDLAIMALDCTANTNGGALTTDADGIVVCSDDDGATGPHTVDTDTTLSEGEVDAFVADNGYSVGPHTVDTDTACSLSACVEPGHATLTCGASLVILNCVGWGGTLWTARSEAEANSWRSVTYGGGLFVAVSDNGTNQVMTSPDGITWTPRAVEASFSKSVTYGDGLFVAVSWGGTNRVMTSPNGITWTARSAAEANVWRSVTYGGGLFVAVANSGTNRVMTSPDGITWTARSATEANGWRSVTYGGGLFVAVANFGLNRVMTSP
jgi:hypothetical protein